MSPLHAAEPATPSPRDPPVPPTHVTQAIEAYARGEIVVVEEDNSRFGVSLTEIVGPADSGQNG